MPSSFDIHTASTDAIKRQIGQAERQLDAAKDLVKEITGKKEAAWAAYKALPTPKPPRSRSVYDKATKQLKAANAKVVEAQANLTSLQNAIEEDPDFRPKKRTRACTTGTSTLRNTIRNSSPDDDQSTPLSTLSSEKAPLSSTQPGKSSRNAPCLSNAPASQNRVEPASSGGDGQPSSNALGAQSDAQPANPSGDIPHPPEAPVVQHHALPANATSNINHEMGDLGQYNEESTHKAMSNSGNSDAATSAKVAPNQYTAAEDTSIASKVAKSPDTEADAGANAMPEIITEASAATEADASAGSGTIPTAAMTESKSEPAANATKTTAPDDNNSEEKEKNKQTPQHWHELSEEEQTALIRKGEKALRTYIATRGNTKISYTLRTWARREASFMPGFATTSRSLAIECLTNLNGNLICPYHCYHDKVGAVNDHVAKESNAIYQVTGVPYRRQVATPGAAKAGGKEGKTVERKEKAGPSLVKPNSSKMNCGCHLEEVLLDFFMWKVSEAESVTTGASETWGENPLRPRDRTFVSGFLRGYGGLIINNLYIFDRDWKLRSEEAILDMQVTRLWKDFENLKAKQLEQIERENQE